MQQGTSSERAQLNPSKPDSGESLETPHNPLSDEDVDANDTDSDGCAHPTPSKRRRVVGDPDDERGSTALRSQDFSLRQTGGGYFVNGQDLSQQQEWVLHSQDFDSPVCALREASHQARPHGNAFTRLDQLTEHDATFGFNPESQFRRVRNAVTLQRKGDTVGFAEKTVPSVAEPRLIMPDCKQLDVINLRAKTKQPPSQGCDLKVLPVRELNGKPNPYCRMNANDWYSVREAVNNFPRSRSARQHETFRQYAAARDMLGGVKIPHGLPKVLYDDLTMWENNPGKLFYLQKRPRR